MARAKKQEERPTLGQELLAVCGLFIALFLLLCLISFAFPTGAIATMADLPANWGGALGSIIAQVFMKFLGLSSFWIVFLLLFFSVQYFSPRASFERLPFIVAGGTGLVLASTGLAASFLGTAPLALLGRSYPAGGYLGDLLHKYLGIYLGDYGALLFFSLFFFGSLMVTVRLSPYESAQRFWNGCRWCVARYRGWRAAAASVAKEKSPVTKKESPPDRQVEEYEVEDSHSMPDVHEPVQYVAEEEFEDDEFQPLPVSAGSYQLPGLNLLDKPEGPAVTVDKEHYLSVSRQLEEILREFKVSGKVVGISPGPVVTTYEYAPAKGVKINRVVALADDLALGLKAESVRIIGSIPGKAAIGIEIPNPERQFVSIRDILAHDTFQNASSKLTLALGMDVVGNPVIVNLAKMPHLLIAGTTGSGKSVAVNAIICNILMKATPAEVRLLLVDPKQIELSVYEDIPHLLHPVVVDPKMASRALQWAVLEMERRYSLMKDHRVKSIASYNLEVEEQAKLPLIVIIIDELADLMMVSSKEVEDSLARLAQKSRAAGMHLLLATQRPSVDVLTGLIKANFPARISFKVSSKIDSRTILDNSGAEHLLGAGDMLLRPPGTAHLKRVHGAYISEGEIERVVEFLKAQGPASYDASVMEIAREPDEQLELEAGDYDEKYDEAVAFVCETGQASISSVQRRFRVGYNRAARMIELMEKEGVVGPADGAKPREILSRRSY